ncbi:MAG: cadherin repeat domain-containing protein [Pseudomonadales bacterium]|nr:cadherin repeat domain-containing protein [Pseudomonadales bacterium]
MPRFLLIVLMLSLLTACKINFDNILVINDEISSSENGGLSNQALTGSLTDVIDVNENETTVNLAQTLADPDGVALVYSLVGGADQALFSVDSVSGNLAFLTAADYEASTAAAGNDIYAVRIKADNGVDAAVEQDVTIYVINVDDGSSQEDWPIIQLQRQVEVSENSVGSIPVFCDDPDDGSEWLQTSGSDADKFTLAEGVLRFAKAPDFEVPTDSDADNIYQLDIICFAQYKTESRSLMAIAVTVTDVTESYVAKIIFPTDKSNIAKPSAATITVTVLADNLENATLPSFTNAQVNGVALQQSVDYPHLWTALVPVSAGDNTLVMSALLNGYGVGQTISVDNTVELDVNAGYGKWSGIFPDADDARIIVLDNFRLLSFPINNNANVTPSLLMDNYLTQTNFDFQSSLFNALTDELYSVTVLSSSQLQLHKVNIDTGVSSSTTISMPAGVDASYLSKGLAADFNSGTLYFTYNSNYSAQSESAIYSYSIATNTLTPFFSQSDALGLVTNWGYIHAIAVDTANQKIYFTMYQNGFFSVDIATKSAALVTNQDIYSNSGAPSIVLDVPSDRAWLRGDGFGSKILEVKLSDGSETNRLSPGGYLGGFTYDALSNKLYVLDTLRQLHRYDNADDSVDNIIYQAGVGERIGKPSANVRNMHVSDQLIDFMAHQAGRRSFYSHYIVSGDAAVEQVSRYTDKNASNYGVLFSRATSQVHGFHSGSPSRMHIRTGGSTEQFPLTQTLSSKATLVNDGQSLLIVDNGKLVSFDVHSKLETVISDALGTPSVGSGPQFSPIADAVIVDRVRNVVWVLSESGLATINLSSGDRNIVLTPTQMFAQSWDSDIRYDMSHFSVDAASGFAFIEYKGQLLKVSLDDFSMQSVRTLPFISRKISKDYSGIRAHADVASQLLWDVNYRGVLMLESLLSGERVSIYQ